MPASAKISYIDKDYKFEGKKKAIKVSWKKTKGISGCRILVSRNKNLEKARVIMVDSPRTSYIIKGLESGKTYYIGIKPYKSNGGKTYLGIIKKKAVKIK